MADPQPVKVPPTFKALLPFIRRAEELDRDTSRPESKLIAYFCRQYAMELGIKLRENDASNETTDYLLSLMDRLENEKDRLPDFTQEEGKEICEDFAMEIFAKADDEDRAGMANKSTARTFYAAGTFFDILHQFGDVSEDVMEKRRYCKYKAATILKAIKNGVAPTPGPPGEADMKAADDGIDDAASAAATMSTASQFSSAPAMPKSDFSPPQRVEPTPSTSLTESVRSAGAMSASELNNALHGLSSTQPSTPSSNQDHSAPVSQYAAPTNPASSYQPSTVPTSAYQPPSAPAYQPPSAPASSTYQPSSAAASSTYQQTASSSSAPTPPSPTAAPPAPTPPSPTPAPPAPTPPSPTPASPAPTLPSPTPPSPSASSYQSRSVQETPARTRNTPVSQNEINDAIEYAKFAVAALKVKDMKLAEERLEMALRNIRGA